MCWNAYVSNAFAWQWLLIPAALIALKIGFPEIRWRAMAFIAASWGWMASVAYVVAFPSDMGFGEALSWICGWMTMLPALALCSVFWFVKRWRGSRHARTVAITVFFVAVMLPILACFRWLPEGSARSIAADELRQHGFTGFQIRGAERTWDGWTVHAQLATQQDYPVLLSRSGFCLGRGE